MSYAVGDWDAVKAELDREAFRAWRVGGNCPFCGQPIPAPTDPPTAEETARAIADAFAGDPIGVGVALLLAASPSLSNTDLSARLTADDADVAGARARASSGAFFAPLSWRGAAAGGAGGVPPQVGTSEGDPKNRLARGPFFFPSARTEKTGPTNPETETGGGKAAEVAKEAVEVGAKKPHRKKPRSRRGGMQSEMEFGHANA